MKTGNAVNIESYAKIAETYHQKTKDLTMHWQREMFLEMLTPHATILDLMCGPGRDARFFSERGYLVTGTDAVQEMITLAQQHAPKAHFFQSNAKTMNISLLYDGLWCNAGLFMFPKTEVPTVIHNMAQLLAPQGALYVNVKLGEGEGLVHDSRYGVDRFESYFQQDELRTLLKEHFHVEREMIVHGQNPQYQTKPFLDLFARKK